MHNREHNNKKVGSAFKYGMTHELPAIIRNNGMGNAVHLYASLVYLSLNNIVDPKKDINASENDFCGIIQ